MHAVQCLKMKRRNSDKLHLGVLWSVVFHLIQCKVDSTVHEQYKMTTGYKTS